MTTAGASASPVPAAGGPGRETRAAIDVLGYADHDPGKHFTDDQLRAWLPKLQGWKIKLALEVGAIKQALSSSSDIAWKYQQQARGVAMRTPLKCAWALVLFASGDLQIRPQTNWPVVHGAWTNITEGFNKLSGKDNFRLVLGGRHSDSPATFSSAAGSPAFG